jgi:diacylglycerol kinase family enzyme
MRIHLVANPTAGRGRARALADAVAAALGARGATPTVHFTTGPGDATAYVAALATDAVDRLVSVGGDGTLHEIVNARPGGGRVPIALVPLGTANLVARDARVPLKADAETYAAIALEGTPWVVDLLETDRGLSLANVGVGLDAAVVRAVAAARRGGVGGYAKWLAPIAKTFLDYAPPELAVSVDGGPFVTGGAAIVQNTRNYGGLFTLASDARMDDGRLEVTVLRRGKRRDFFRMLLRAYSSNLDRDSGVAILRGTSVEIRSGAPVPTQSDGDPFGETPVRVRVAPRALTLLRPGPHA